MNIALEVERNLKAAGQLVDVARKEHLDHNVCIAIALRALGGQIDEHYLRIRSKEGSVLTQELFRQAGTGLGLTDQLCRLDRNTVLDVVNYPEQFVNQRISDREINRSDVLGFIACHKTPGNINHALSFGRLDGYTSDLPIDENGQVFIADVLMGDKTIGLVGIGRLYDHLKDLDDLGCDVLLSVVVKGMTSQSGE